MTNEEDDSLPELLADSIADILSDKKWALFMQPLFAQSQGLWVDVLSVCDELNINHSNFEQIEESLPSPLFATWLPFPESVYGEEYCVVIFFVEEIPWSKAVIYNKKLV